MDYKETQRILEGVVTEGLQDPTEHSGRDNTLLVALIKAVAALESLDELLRLCEKCHNRKRINHDGAGLRPTEVFQVVCEALDGDLTGLKILAGEKD